MNKLAAVFGIGFGLVAGITLAMASTSNHPFLSLSVTAAQVE